MSKKVKLYILGLSYSQTQTGAYALVLAEEKGERRIPIIIGAPEAQSIAIQLEGLRPTRPLTHDLFLNFSNAFKIVLEEVNIYKLEEGIFYSEMICDDGVNKIRIDARTSDAVALALRFRCPIFTTEEILDKAGIILDFEEKDKQKEDNTDSQENEIISDEEFENLSIEELNEMLNDAINEENYEQASEIKNVINRKKEEKSE